MIYHRILNIAPCVIQFRTLFIHSIYTSLHLLIANFRFIPLQLSSLGNHQSTLCCCCCC